MKIHHLFVDKQGESHFEDMEIPYIETGRAGKLSARLPATGIIFREVAPDYDLDWHPAPRRQYIINLDAGVQITASDGQSRKIGAGEVILVEDTWGKGHLSKALDGKLRHCIFVPDRVAARPRQVRLARTRVPAAESMPPMPLTSEQLAPGTWRAPHSPRSWRVASMIGKMPYMPEWV